MAEQATPEDILSFWFPDDRARANALWWGKDPALDAEIRARFGQTRARAKAGELDHWARSPRGRLAVIIVLDQFSRNLFRGDPETHAADEHALTLALEGIAAGDDRALRPIERLFMYMPLEHAEALEHQERCVQLVRALADEVAAEPGVDTPRRDRFASYVDFAIRHRDIVARFGRFPHRNALLGRESTPEELAFLEQPNSSF
ncbi:DUF924 domain-containing protein [Pseudenhygromyxa sp. WMMC2535]|uniref:DUF924 family protein n=1 Tax=Pseudenhygromyxa sp. WMMC2535 TaxID=2712867 RepID=UPI001557A47C|nr:DUF924 family protein [Pseudenhygromyxa sp. WMMC2535]NVB42349.1 DUF924 domain-containing protein [Pseudenhygromyxa sp. WMMC2535]